MMVRLETPLQAVVTPLQLVVIPEPMLEPTPVQIPEQEIMVQETWDSHLKTGQGAVRSIPMTPKADISKRQ